MDYTCLIENKGGKISKVGIVGATRGYGYTLLVQIPKVKNMVLRVICSRHPEDCRAVLEEIGYSEEKIVYCEDKVAIEAAAEDAVLIVKDYRLMEECGITSLVETTGNTQVGSDAAERALKKGINVYMVSKETDSVCGTYMRQLAEKNQCVYTLVNGDQPRNLLDLISWARLLGLEIVCAGKSSEYDFVWNRETGEFRYTDGSGAREMLPELLDCWRYEGTRTLDKRARLLNKYIGVISADLCEMNLVSNVSGLLPATPFMHYPVAKISELANIFIPKEDGGILDRTGVVDVFNNFREEEEASFCGGEFIIIRCENKQMWELLRGKGHAMSSNGKYCCIYTPYHYLGMETPASILLGDLMGIGNRPETRQVSVLAAVAEEDIPAGTVFEVHGHHHAIDNLAPELLETSQVGEAVPFYLLNGAKLLRELKKGEAVTMSDVDLTGIRAYEMFCEGLKI